ncbi:MAG: TetR/AcrR family transcriptional regulator [Bacteroidaceae bacterium]|nr:TetR/AcrR family transcriptional regulator [Bacteroidaceae bacterium]
MENKIIDAARSVFIEKGYAETSMSEIAARVGINRPALHYYFRTKEKMFQAVFGSIVSSVVPKVFDALTHKEKSISQRVEGIIDAYYALFLENPQLPMFILRELNRDSDLLINTIQQFNVMDTVHNALASVQEEMNEGKLRKVSLQFTFYNFYSLLTFPFLTKDISTKVFRNDDKAFRAMLVEWKQNIIAQMLNLLEVK